MTNNTTNRTKPEWAKAAIVAEYQIDRSDSQTDYFATSTGREVFLGWSRSARVSFAELRKAAAAFEPTKGMGPGRDRYTVIVVAADDFIAGGSAYYTGNLSHWHHGEEHGEGREFSTQAEAEAFVAAAPVPDAITFGEKTVGFTYKIRRESYEHRERYSMGRGLVLGASAYCTGWVVRKVEVGGYGWADVLTMAGPDDMECAA